jgi:translocator protein
MYATSITPAGFTFSIWSIIYLSWLVLGFYNIFYKKKEKIKKQDLYFLASAQILTVLWLIPWHYNFI